MTLVDPFLIPIRSASPSNEIQYARQHLTNGTFRIRTHSHVDLDAAFSVALWAHLIGREIDQCEIICDAKNYVPSSEIVCLDIGGGIKGRVTSAFEELSSFLPPTDQEALRDLIGHITLEDRAALMLIDPSYKAGMLAQQIENKHVLGMSDVEICLWAASELAGYLKGGMERIRNERFADQAVLFANGKIALTLSDKINVQDILFGKGVEFVVYDCGDNVGVKRSPKITKPDLGLLFNADTRFDGFYKDSGGFILCSGSLKCPAKSAPPIRGHALAELLEQRVFPRQTA